MRLGQKILSATAILLGIALASPASANPSLFWVSDTVLPDDTVLVTGAGLSGVDEVLVERLADKDGAGSGPQAATILAGDAHSLRFVVPADLPDGVFRFELKGGKGETATGLLNAPTVYWTQGDSGMAATAGGWLRVLGRNISRENAASLRLVREGSADVVLRQDRGNLWDAAFAVPPDLPPGRYEAILDNGSGGAEAARTAGAVTIVEAPPASALRIDVRERGATGDGKTDDSGAIQSALDEAGTAGGGTVFVPRGYYRVTRPLSIPLHVRLVGASRDLTSLVWEDFKEPPLNLIEGISDFAVEDMTLAARHHANVISGGFDAEGKSLEGGNITVRRVTIRASSYLGRISPQGAAKRLEASLKLSSGGGDSIRLAGSNLRVEDCDVLGSGRSLFLLGAHGAHIVGNRLYNGRLGWYSITGSDGVIMEGNRIEGADLQSAGGGINTLSKGSPRSENILFYRNRVERVLGWDREAMTSDGGGGYYYGRASAAGERSLVLDEEIRARGLVGPDWSGASLFVLDGEAMGGRAEIVSREGNRVELDRPIPIGEDGARVTIVPTQQNYLIVDNEFVDAGLAAQFFGNVVDSVVYGNKSIRTGGFRNRGLNYRRAIQPAWYNQFLNNELLVGDVDRPASIILFATSPPNESTPLNYGSIVRGNRLDGNAQISIRGGNPRALGVRTAIVEKNDVRNSDVGIYIDEGSTGILLRDNRFENVVQPIQSAGTELRCNGPDCLLIDAQPVRKR